jgi:energy-coupling factor transport system ATP-binding protein
VGGAEPPAALGRVALLFQSPERNLFERSVAEELAFTLRRTGVRGARLEERVARLLERCGLAHLRERSPLRLSFGEQHRVALASLLAPRPDLLLLDEPFAGLDAESRGRVLELLDAEQREAGFAVLIASHDPLPAPGWAHRELALRQGVLQRA